MNILFLGVLLFSLFAIIAVTVEDGLQIAEAENTSEHPDNTKKLSPKSFGSKTGKVCGDRLC